MNHLLKSILAVTFVLCMSLSALAQSRVTTSFDKDWLFLKSDAQGAEQSNFADSTWRKLDVPHDWSIEGPFDAKNPTGGAGGFLPAGIGWYRKHFTVPKDQTNRRVFIDFDGIMANSDVWINGFHLGKRPYGYVSFQYELTGHLNLGGDNVICFVNGLGGTPLMELYVLYNEVAKILGGHGVQVARSLVGSYITSLDMAGASVTLLRVDDELVSLWDAPVRTPALRPSTPRFETP